VKKKCTFYIEFLLKRHKTIDFDIKIIIIRHFEEKKIGQNFDFLAHSGGCNLTEIIFYVIFKHHE
jgi:hypothetical protein